MKKYYCAVCETDIEEGGCIHKAPWKYQSGDATRTQQLKEAGLTWEQYRNAMVSVEEFIKFHKGEFDLIKSIKWKQKLFNGEKVYSKEWSAPTKDWHDGMNFGFEQALSLVYNWFNPD